MGVTDENRTLWVTGAGSGIGQAVALSAARSGYRVAVSGRRRDALDETAELIRREGGVALAVPLDVGSGEEVERGHALVVATLGAVTHLVCAAGANTKNRSWHDQSMEDFESVVQVNLMGTARTISAVLPGMRAAGGGSVVIVSSFAGWTASAYAGVGYSASKTALSTLAVSLNAQEGGSGIRCCHLCPGDTDTDFLRLRPVVPTDDARTRMLSAEDVARSVQFVLDSPSHVTIDELVVSPISQQR